MPCCEAESRKARDPVGPGARTVYTWRSAGKPAQVDASEQRAVADERNRVGGPQLMMNLALAIGRVERGRNRSGKRRGVVGNAKLPAIGKEDADGFAGTNSGCHESARHALHQLAVSPVGDAPRRNARGVDDRNLRCMPAARLQHNIVYKLAFGIGEELRPQSWLLNVRIAACARVYQVGANRTSMDIDDVAAACRQSRAHETARALLSWNRLFLTPCEASPTNAFSSPAAPAVSAPQLPLASSRKARAWLILDRDPEGCERIRRKLSLTGGDHCRRLRPRPDPVRFRHNPDAISDGLDVVINNAGISIRHNFLDITPEEWNAFWP